MKRIEEKTTREAIAEAVAALVGKIGRFGLCLFVAAWLTACGGDSSEISNTVSLPTDDSIPLNLYCADIGIHEERCVLDDPGNPYARAIVSEQSKFTLDAVAPSATARFYLWATALARGAGAPGENQFYVALYLHRMWASSNSELTRLQALRAYRSYLDNYFNAVTFFEIPQGSGNLFPQSLNTFTGQLLFNPTNVNNTFSSTRLFSQDPNVNRDMASIEVGSWGYFYNQTSGQFSRNF